MKLPTFAAAAAAAALTVALGAPMANAAVTPSAAPTAPSVAADDDCYYTHHWNGVWHPHARLVCDYDSDFDHDYWVAHPEFRGHMGEDRMGDRNFRDNNHTDGRDSAAVNNNATPADRAGTNNTAGDPSADRRSPAERGEAGTAAGSNANTPTSNGGAPVQPRH